MSGFDSPSRWYPPPETPILSGNDVHVWRASLDLSSSHLKRLWHLLSVDERQRAEQFVFQRDQDKFIAARGLLRMVLSRYLSIEPAKLRFDYGPYGKPELAREMNKHGLCFNLSHSGNLALYAMAVSQVGVDLERIQPDLDYEAIAQRYFSSQEATALLALSSSYRCKAFFRLWTCKEAYLKAKGEGIFQGLSQVEISLTSTDAATFLRIDGDPQTAANWSLQELSLGPGYVAAVVIGGANWQIKCWQWSEENRSPLW